MGDNDPRHKLLYDAITARNEANALSIARSGVDVNGVWDECTHLVWAIAEGLDDVTACLLEHGADVDMTVPGNSTPLGVAVDVGRQDMLEFLVEEWNAQLDVRTASGRAALYAAVVVGNLDSVKCLVSRGCTIDAQDDCGNTPLDCADQDHPELVQFLASASFLSTKKDYHGLIELCGRSSPFLDRRFALCMRTTFMFCLVQTKKIQNGGDVAPSDYAGITLTSRIYDHEKDVVRHILPYVGANQGAAYDQQVLHHKALLAISSQQQSNAELVQTIAELRQTNASQQQTISSQQLTNASQQQINASQQQTIAELTAALSSGDGLASVQACKGE